MVDSASQFRSEWTDAPYAHARARFGDLLRWVVVTNGRAGATAYGPDEVITVPALPALQVDAAGAGDAFAAGLLHGLLLSQPISDAMALGARWGAAAVETRQSVPPISASTALRTGRRPLRNVVD